MQVSVNATANSKKSAVVAAEGDSDYPLIHKHLKLQAARKDMVHPLANSKAYYIHPLNTM